MFIQQNGIGVSYLQKEDIPLMVQWLSDPKVLEFYEGRDKSFDAERVQKKFFDRDDGVARCLVEYQGNKVGYIQFYPLDSQSKDTFGYLNEAERIYGIDQFIGETGSWNKGLGTKLVKAVVSYLVGTHDADRVVLDPRIENKRAIRCYQKCGFSSVKVLHEHEYHEGQYHDNYLMEYKKE